MNAHEIILAEWRESFPAIKAGKDPLDRPKALGAYMDRFGLRHDGMLNVGEECGDPGCDLAAYKRGLCQGHYFAMKAKS